MENLDEKTLKYLENLARLYFGERSGKDEEKFLKDLKSILGYFDRLKEVNTDGIEPMAGGLRLAEGSLRPAEGGTTGKNVFREDKRRDGNSREKEKDEEQKKVVNEFPDKKDGFLKLPAVFE